MIKKSFSSAVMMMFMILFSSLPVNAQLKWAAYGNSNEIRALCEDDNYVWMATNNGLIKRTKNGVTVAHLTSDNSVLPSNDIYALAMDHNSTLWIGTAFGVCAYNKYTGQWNVYNTTNGLPGNKVKAIAVDLSGNVWIGNYSPSYITKFDGTKFTRDSVPGGVRINAMTIDAKNNLWICSGHGVYKYDYHTWVNYYPPKLPWKEAFCIAIENGGRKWIGTSKGLCMYNDTVFKSFFVAEGLADDYVTSISIDGNNKWFSTINGITKYDNSAWTTYNSSNSGLVNNSIMSSLLDVQGNIWFGTAAGLSKKSAATWTTFMADGLAGTVVNSVKADNKGNKWFATSNGISCFNGISWKSYSTANGLISNTVQCLAIDKKGNKWFGCLGGVSKYNDTVFTNYTTAQGLVENNVVSIAIDSSGNIWFGTGGGVSKFNGTIWNNYTTSDGLVSSFVNAMAAEKDGDMWFGTNNGLSFFNGSVFTNYNEPDGLVYHYIYSLAIDKNNNKWIGTYYGVSRFDGTTWKTYTTANGLAGDRTQTIYPDILNDEIWFGSYGYGITRYNYKNSWKQYTINDGLSSNMVYSIDMDNLGVIWCGTSVGASKAVCENAVPLFTADTACLPTASTHLISVTEKTDNMSVYKWTIDDNGTPVNYDTTAVTRKFSKAGITSVKLEVKNRNCIAGITKNIVIGIKPDAHILSTLPNSFCMGLQTQLKGTDSSWVAGLDYEFYWSTGETTENIKTDTTGKYSLIISDYSCKDTAFYNILVKEPFKGEKICMVTVDYATGKNKIIWPRTKSKNTQSYNIYKVFGMLYQPIGNVPFDSLSVFKDFTSIPESMVDRYAISAIDSCGNESAKSPFHQTMLLQAAKGTAPNEAVLNWNKYIDESGDWKPEYYYIYKGKTRSSMMLIDSISALLETRYNDQKFDGISAYYQCVIVKKTPCSPAILKAESGPYTQSLSNIVEFKTGSALSIESELAVSVFPNPFSENLNLAFSLDKSSDVMIEVINPTGQKTAEFSYKNLAAGNQQIQLSATAMNISEGICYVKIVANEKTSVVKCNFIK